MISDHLTKLSYLFPWSIIIALVLACLFAVLGILLFRRSLTKADELPSPDVINPWLEKAQIFMARYGYYATDRLSLSFSSALKLMHSFIGGTQFRYKLPWIVMLGATDAGKSSILSSLNLDRPIGRPRFESEDGDKPLCDWMFYDHGIVLDVNGKLLIGANQFTSDESNWDLFINLLATHRPKRPLDGVVLNIPATELIGRDVLSHEDLMIRADYLYEKLWQMQLKTGIRIPIYIVITKCDNIPGFESFCKSIPQQNRNNIFGWSNDKSLDTFYISDWIDEAFSSINASLYRAQEEIYADGPTMDGRDGVFLFPLAFNKLKSGVRTYTDHIFKPSGYHESFFLRGIYFVGDSHIDLENAKTKGKRNIPLAMTSSIEDKRLNLYFLNDLFEKKIFRETGLARPVSRILLGNTNTIRLVKIGVVVASIIGTLGLLLANSKLQTARIALSPALKQVEITLEKIRGQNETTNNNRAFFYDQAQTLLNVMSQISSTRLSSTFIPASWFSTLNSRISFVMGLAYDQVILRSMAGQLAYKAQQLVDLNTVLPVSQAPGNGIDPLQTSDFYQLQKYVISIRELELAANKFNELGVASSLKDVAEIIKYLFDFEMPADFYTHDVYFKDALAENKNKVFDFDFYKDDASIKLRKLFTSFENSAFDPIQMVPGLGHLMSSLNKFAGTGSGFDVQGSELSDVDTLRDVHTSLAMTNNSISNPGFSWINTDLFSPGPQYEYVMGLIFASNLFSTTTAVDLKNDVDQNFISFRKKLADYKSPLISGGYLFTSQNGLALSKPSDGSVTLQQNLSLFFNEPFMAPAEDRTILLDIPSGSILLWDTLRLQQGVNLITSYNDFINTRLLGMPKNLQPMLQKVGKDSLAKNLIQQISNAQVLNANTFRESTFAPEDSLLSQIQNYRAAAPFLEQILFSLTANNINSTFSILRKLLTNENYSLLEKLDNILREEAPYAIKMNSFEWWKGENLAALEAFGANNITELKSYLDLQRDRLYYLSHEFAEPIVQFLEQINSEGLQADLPLVNKWAGIVSELNGYRRKAPGNGLTELENYIVTPLNEVTLETCMKYSNIFTLSLKNDYFVDILLDLQDKLHKRCVNLSGFVSVDNYTQLAQFFNANLAGKFPFTELANGSSPDAAPEDIRTFFEMMDTEATGIKATLKQAKSLGAPGKKALTFIEQMEKIRAFFGGYLAVDSSMPYPAFTFDVTFRVNKQRELRANEVLDWEIKSGCTSFNMRSPSHKCAWSTGAPVKVIFRWAANSPLQPLETDSKPHFSVDGEYASFSYGGTWALLRLLREHQTKSCDFDSLNDEEPTTLRFDIPLTNVISGTGNSTIDPLQATVFIRFATAPVKKAPVKKEPAPAEDDAKKPEAEKIKMGTPVDVPFFPYHAPDLENAGNIPSVKSLGREENCK